MWTNDGGPGDRPQAFASRNFCDALKYAGPIAVQSCTAAANLMIVLGVYQTAGRWQVAGVDGDSAHDLQALEWFVSDVYFRAWVGRHAQELGRPGCEKAGRFNWDGLHDHRDIIATPKDSHALRVKTQLANNIEEEKSPMSSQFFLANPLPTRMPLPDRKKVTSRTGASNASRQASAAHTA